MSSVLYKLNEIASEMDHMPGEEALMQIQEVLKLSGIEEDLGIFFSDNTEEAAQLQTMLEEIVISEIANKNKKTVRTPRNKKEILLDIDKDDDLRIL